MTMTTGCTQKPVLALEPRELVAARP